MENKKTGFIEKISGTMFIVNAYSAENAKQTQEEIIKALIEKEAIKLTEESAA